MARMQPPCLPTTLTCWEIGKRALLFIGYFSSAVLPHLLFCLSPSLLLLLYHALLPLSLLLSACLSSAFKLLLLCRYFYCLHSYSSRPFLCTLAIIYSSPPSPCPFNQQLPYSPRYVGPYTTLSPELSFVVEDSEGVCGYVLATLDSSQFYDCFLNDWLPTIIGKYPKPSAEEEQRNPEQVSNIQLRFRGWVSALTC